MLLFLPLFDSSVFLRPDRVTPAVTDSQCMCQCVSCGLDGECVLWEKTFSASVSLNDLPPLSLLEVRDDLLCAWVRGRGGGCQGVRCRLWCTLHQLEVSSLTFSPLCLCPCCSLVCWINCLDTPEILRFLYGVWHVISLKWLRFLKPFVHKHDPGRELFGL